MSIPLGVSYQNPGNLRPLPNGQLWDGQTGVFDGFCVFDTAEHGLRALAKDLINQQRLHALDTVSLIVGKYAPPADGNDTAAYIADVAKRLGVDPSAKIDLEDAGVLEQFVTAVVKHEQGEQPYGADLIAAAATDALAA